MTTLPPDTPNKRPADAQKPADALSHQERVYFEMFRAIEQLGRKLEKAEAERYLLSRRLGDIEASAEKDEETGRYYLPAKIEPMISAPPQGLSGAAKGSIAASFVFALLALGAVVMQDMPQKSAGQQMAAIDALLKQGGETLTAARGEWHRRTVGDVPAPAAVTPATEIAEAPAAPAQAETAPAEMALAVEPTLQAEAETLAEVAPASAPAAAEFTVVSPPVQLVQAEQPPALTMEVAEQTAYLREAMAAVPPAEAHEEDAEDFSEHLAEALGDLHGEVTEVSEAAPDVVAVTEDANNIAEEVTAAADDAAFTVASEPAAPQVTEVAEAPTPAVKAEEAPKAKVAAVESKPAPASAAKPVYTPPATAAGLPRVSRDETLPPALMAMQERAFEGVPEAQHDLAAIYAEGQRVPKSYLRARAWFAWAAATGLANAHYNLAVMDQQGLGGPVNMPAALGHYTKAADLGHPEAMYNLGLYYTDKRNNGYNAARGVAFFKRAANAGMVQAAYNLGVIYEGDMLGKADIQSALEWYGVAAGDGNTDAARAVTRLSRLQTQRAAAGQ